MPVDAVSGMDEDEATHLGYGLGFRLDTAVGLMGVAFAFGEGDTFSTAKLHFRLLSEF